MHRLALPRVRQLYARFPTLIRSKDWEAAVERIKKDDYEGALEIARAAEGRSKQLTAQNVVARRIRLQRIKLFVSQDRAVERLQLLFRDTARHTAAYAKKHATSWTGIKLVKSRISAEMAVLRRNLRKAITDAIWEAILLGVRNTEDALLPIFKENKQQESFATELTLLEGRRVSLQEDALSFGLNKRLLGRSNPQLKRGGSSYKGATDKVYEKLAQEHIKGATLSERVWDLTKRAELDLQAAISREFGKGGSPSDIAKRIEDLLDPDVRDRVEGIGQGVYRSPFKNAMRLTRTETGRAYTSAQAAWASSREWVKGMMVTLSPAHDPGSKDGDICDEEAGTIYSPEEFDQKVPFHPHCMCFGTIVIKDEFLEVPTEEEEAVR